jgi:2-keto-4-pentenoate hydratase
VGRESAIAPGMHALLGEWRKRIAAGESRVGWKIGLNVPAVQRQLGISGPVIGFLTSASLLAPGAVHSLAGGTRVGVEPEIGIRVQDDVPPDAGAARARAAIGALCPAIEIVDINLPFEDLTQILAGNVFHRAVMLGADDPARAGGELRGVGVSVIRNDREEAAALAAEEVGDPGQVVHHVAGLLDRFGERLRAGDVIISGSLTSVVWVEPEDRVEVAFDSLGKLEASFSY